MCAATTESVTDVERLYDIARAVADAGGRALFVGGLARDLVRASDDANSSAGSDTDAWRVEPRRVDDFIRARLAAGDDADVEVFGLSSAALETLLANYGNVRAVGRSFGVFRIDGLNADFSLPRRDNKIGPGHQGFDIEIAPELDFSEAARRRDFRMNSMGLDPLTHELFDPHSGRADLAARQLRVTDARHFAEDPLRGLRAAQFAARFELEADAELLELAAELDLDELPAERIWHELYKLLLQGVRPSIGFEFLRETGLVRFFPEVEALIGVPQDPRWHPEGDVWTHNLMVLDRAATFRQGNGTDDDVALMFAALCHDFGKPATTDEQLRAHGHAEAGVEPTRVFLERLRAPRSLNALVCALVRHHLAPAMYVHNGAQAKGYRRLARRLAAVGGSLELLVRVATADHLGRTTPDALAGEFPEGTVFLERAHAALPELRPPPPAVQGRHLIARGFEPGPEFGRILAACEEIQDATGWSDPEQILKRVLDEGAGAPTAQEENEKSGAAKSKAPVETGA